MTAIGSIEALEQVPEGEQILVRSRQTGAQRWTKASNGFTRESAVVGAEFFVGYITEGRVTTVDDSPARPGEWFQQRRYDYFHYAMNDAGLLVSLTFYNGEFRSDNTYIVEQFDHATTAMVRLEGAPERVLVNQASVRRILDRYHDHLMVVTTQLAAATERLASKPERKAAERPTQHDRRERGVPEEPVLQRVQVTITQGEQTWTVEVPRDGTEPVPEPF